jgi:hypothetical protein
MYYGKATKAFRATPRYSPIRNQQMKKIAALCLLLLSAPAMACTFKTMDSESMRSIVKERGGYPVSDEVCGFLNKNGLSLKVSGHATVLDGVSVSWVEVRLWKNGVSSDQSRFDTTVNRNSASMVTAGDTLYKGLEKAVLQFDYKLAAAEVDGYLAKHGKKK